MTKSHADAVILAGGRGARLAGLVPEFHKPLLEIDGVPLVRRAVELTIAVGIDHPVVVVSPQNAGVIHDVLEDLPASLVVQRWPLGPGDALLTGLRLSPTAHADNTSVLVLLSDNVLTKEDLRSILQHDTAVGVNGIPRADAERYTRYERGRWIEKEPLSIVDTLVEVPCWVGPLLVNRWCALDTLERVWNDYVSRGREVPIGPHINLLVCKPDNQPPTLVHVSAVDVGTIESYRNYTEVNGD